MFSLFPDVLVQQLNVEVYFFHIASVMALCDCTIMPGVMPYYAILVLHDCEFRFENLTVSLIFLVRFCDLNHIHLLNSMLHGVVDFVMFVSLIL